MSQFSFDVTEADFEQRVLQSSRALPVIVDFWASWCQPCKVLKPMLEKLAEEHQGSFLLAKVDTEAWPNLAAHFGVRGIPDVRAFVDGRVVDGFTGALTEAQVREFLHRIMPSPAAPIVQRAQALLAQDDAAGALAQLREAVAVDPALESAWVMLIEQLIIQGFAPEAAEVLPAVADRIKDRGRLEALQARLALNTQERPAGADVDELTSRVNASPDDLDLRLTLANALVGIGAWEQALEQLLTIVRRDRTHADEAARKKMVQIFTLPELDPGLVRRYRSALASALNC
jgi:putative thioredoxin